MPFVAEISEGCWLAPWEGDPGRTVVIANAKRYKTWLAAEVALKKARGAYRWRKIKGRVVEVECGVFYCREKVITASQDGG